MTEADIRRRLDGDHGERVADRVGRWRHIIAARGEASEVYVARLAGQLVGFTSPFVEPGGRHRVGSLYVLPRAQGQGVGSRLMRKNLDWHGTSPVYLAVVAYNVRSIEFYRRFGFRETGRQVPDLSAREGGDKELPEIEMMRPAGA